MSGIWDELQVPQQPPLKGTEVRRWDGQICTEAPNVVVWYYHGACSACRSPQATTLFRVLLYTFCVFWAYICSVFQIAISCLIGSPRRNVVLTGRSVSAELRLHLSDPNTYKMYDCSLPFLCQFHHTNLWLNFNDK